MLRSVALGLGLFSLLTLGCGKKGREVVTLSGVVTYKGNLVVGGAIYFHAADNQVAMGAIHDDGTFIATEVPVGEVRVSFQFKDGPGGDMYGTPGKPKGVTKLPDNFNDPNTSGLKYTITSGTSTLEVKID
ncbi:hypothetical protein BH11PLA2_BH11PLA2_27340 [soil metagenome]